MGAVGVNPATPGSEIRVDLKSRFLDRALHLLGALIPGASLAMVLGAFTLLRQQPKEGFELLRQWGAWWVVVLVVGYWIWSLGMRLIDKLERLASGVQDSAVSIARLADRDDRERDRMITETAYVSQKVREVSATLVGMKEQNDRIEQLLQARQEG